MTGVITVICTVIAALVAALIFALKQVETTIPVVTSVAKKLIDARQEITEHYRKAKQSGAAELSEAQPVPCQATASGQTVGREPRQHAA